LGIDQQALFLELLTENAGRWRGIARAYARQDAEDLLQEILLQVWRSLATFRNQSSRNTWSYRVALNTAISWRRSERTRRARLPVRDGYSPSLVACRPPEHTGSNLLEQLLADLSAADKAILLLYLDNVSYIDMAEILGATEGGLRVRIHRIKKRLAELYEERRDGS
jgi:RNA polymerase sigma-70 factor (ECF subfamily)